MAIETTHRPGATKWVSCPFCGEEIKEQMGFRNHWEYECPKNTK